MLGTRYEQYEHIETSLPFVLRTDIERTSLYHSKAGNFHEELELQLCTRGEGSVLLDGVRYPFAEGDIIVANSGVLHCTDSNGYLAYDCLIIKSTYCKEVGIDPARLAFAPHIKSDTLKEQLLALRALCESPDDLCRVAKLYGAVLAILTELASNHLTAVSEGEYTSKKSLECIKSATRYIRENYRSKITLEELAKVVLVDKYTLCRLFKKVTGQTVFEYLNRTRCLMAAEQIAEGATATEAALASGYESLSYFAKSFKKYVADLPSRHKK